MPSRLLHHIVISWSVTQKSSGQVLNLWAVVLNLCRACSATDIKSDVLLANNDELLHKTLVTDEVYEISDHQRLVVKRRVSVV